MSAIYNGTVLQSIGSAVTYFKILSTTSEFQSQAFYPAQNSLVTLESEENNALTEIPSRSFYQFIYLETVDLSNCKQLTELAGSSFQGCISLRSITFPDTEMYFRGNVFNSCSNLTSITIPRLTTQIDPTAFQISGLEKVIIPEDSQLGAIYNNAFTGTNILSFTIPLSLRTINGNPFVRCYNLTEIIIPEGQQYFIYEDGILYSYQKNLIVCCLLMKDGSFTIPESVTELSAYSFSYTKISEIIIPESIGEISQCCFANSYIENVAFLGSPRLAISAFQNCDFLTYINLKEGLEEINWYSFADCSQLTTVVIPSSCKALRQRSFQYCGQLKNFTIKEGLQTIEWFVFEGCSSLTEIHLPSTIQALSHPISSGNIQFYAYNGQPYITENNILYNENKTMLIQEIYTNQNNTYEIPSTVQIISQYAFYYSRVFAIKIQSLENSITFKTCCFQNCEITTITIQNARSIYFEQNALSYSNIDNISISQVDSCSLNFRLIGTSIHSLIFHQGIDSNITFQNSLTNINTLTTFCIFQGSGSILNLDNVVFTSNSNLENVVLECNIEYIPKHCFENCVNLYNISIPETVESIEAYAFSRCTSLVEFTFPENSQLKKICSYSFSSSGINIFTLPNDVVEIEEGAFHYCNNLETFEINPSLTTLPDHPFLGCSSMKQITSSSPHFVVQESVLYNNDLTDIIYLPPLSTVSRIDLPNTAQRIYSYAFYNCKNLIHMNIPYSLTEIGNYSFYGCTNLGRCLPIERMSQSFHQKLIEVGQLPSYCICKANTNYKIIGQRPSLRKIVNYML